MSNEEATTKLDGGASVSTAGLGITGTLTGPFTMAIAAPTRTEKTTPDAYRLAKKPDGTLVLQGAYMWQEGWNNYGHEWRDIPTVELQEARYGCHCDLGPDEQPDYCWIDRGQPDNCCLAVKLIADGKGRDDCSEWRRIEVMPNV